MIHKSALILTCCLLSATQLFSKITMEQMRQSEQFAALSLRAQSQALKSTKKKEKRNLAMESLRYGLKANNLGCDCIINQLLNGSTDLYVEPKMRDGIRKKQLQNKKKKNTFTTKEFQDFRRLALMSGKLTQASKEICSKESELHSIGMTHFVEALEKMNKISHPKWEDKKKQLIQSSVTQLGIDARRNNKNDLIQFHLMLKKLYNV